MPIRVRLAAAFGAAAAVLVALGGWLFVSLLSSSMLGSLDAQLTTAAGAVARYVTVGGDQKAPATPLPGEYLFQVIDASGRVAASGPDAGNVPLVSAATLRRAAVARVTLTRVVDGESTRIVAEPYAGRAGSVAVAAVSLESSYLKSVATIETGVALGGAAVVVVAFVGSYLLARRALAPVERMRRQVLELSGSGAAAGLQVPATRDELATLARTMNDLLGRLHGSLERQRTFVADASHELRSPLAVLRGELELAARPGRSRAQLQDAVASAEEEVTRLTRLVEDLLLLARSDGASLALRPERVDVAALLHQVRAASTRRALEAEVALEVSVPGTLTALADPLRLRQALDNLIDNALRFAPRDSAIEVRASADAGALTLEVLDRGPGFPEDYLPHAFERFTRPSDDRSRVEGGAGLGLAIVAAVAEAHGGAASVCNRPGGGACVRLVLPLGPPDAAAAARTDGAVTGVGGARGAG